ncbi:MAG: thiosulfate oxidation carrier protein SoxY [Xanthomonadaceae bacterium]|nr:thiosulfate oxidation carrier protein SoxY [Xanthomonadaceae bacterium]
MNSLKRRTFLKGTAAISSVGFALGAGLLTPRMVLAAWPQSAFESKSVDDALNNLAGSADLSTNEQIQIRAPDIAENGNVVPITVETNIANIESISILTEKNTSPLTASFVLGAGAEGFVATRMKMGKTSDVIAVVKADGKLHSTRKEVKVTIGGCGG